MIEKIRKWVKDKTGVSPIIAIILMVAITVVLAATIYVWVSGMGGGGSTAPSLTLKVTDDTGDNSFSDTAQDDIMVVDHMGGDKIKCEDIKILVTDPNGNEYTLLWDSANTKFADSTNGLETDTTDIDDGYFAVGEEFTIKEDSGHLTLASTGVWHVKIIYIPSNSILYDKDITVE